jgi:hypothetical protein
MSLEVVKMNLIEINFLAYSNFVKHPAWIMLALATIVSQSQGYQSELDNPRT